MSKLQRCRSLRLHRLAWAGGVAAAGLTLGACSDDAGSTLPGMPGAGVPVGDPLTQAGAVGVDAPPVSAQAVVPSSGITPLPAVGEPAPEVPSAVVPVAVSPTPVDVCAGPPVPGDAVFARLSANEYSSTARTLTGLEDAGAFIRSIKTAGFITTSGPITDRTELNAYVGAAERLADAALENRAELADKERFSDAAFVRSFLESFGAEAFRRPLRSDEVERYFEAYLGGLEFSPEEGMRWLLSSLLASPNFIYRVERGEPDAALPENVRSLTPWETASRLSYFFTGGMPDAELQTAAGNNALTSKEQLLDQARRLVNSPLGRQRVSRFVAEWLGIEDIDSAATDRLTRFDPQRPEAPDALRESLQAVVEHVAYEQGGTLQDLLTTPLVFLNDTLAESWGLDANSGEDMVARELPEEHRLGILTHPSFLSIHSTTSFASASLRGGFIAEHVMCTPVPEPDASILAQFPEIQERSATNRETLETEHMVPGCIACHGFIDPLGFAFENFDAGGRFTTTEQHGAFPETAIDASGEVLIGGERRPYSNAAEFVKLLSESPGVQACVSRHVLRFALHRDDSVADNCTLQQISNHLSAGEGKITELFAGFAATDAFRYLTVNMEGNPSQ